MRGLSNQLSPPTHPVLKHQGCHWLLYLFSIGFKYKFFCHSLCLPIRKFHFPTVFGVLISSGIDCETWRRAQSWETFITAWFTLQPMPSRDLPLVVNCTGLRSLLRSGRNKASRSTRQFCRVRQKWVHRAGLHDLMSESWICFCLIQCDWSKQYSGRQIRRQRSYLFKQLSSGWARWKEHKMMEGRKMRAILLCFFH